jgi:hypothetical protein
MSNDSIGTNTGFSSVNEDGNIGNINSISGRIHIKINKSGDNIDGSNSQKMKNPRGVFSQLQLNPTAQEKMTSLMVNMYMYIYIYIYT